MHIRVVLWEEHVKRHVLSGKGGMVALWDVPLWRMQLAAPVSDLVSRVRKALGA